MFLTPAAVHAEPVRTVHGPRILLSDVVTDAPADLAGLDFGPAPAPGASRLVTRSEVQSRLRRLGHDTSALSIPESVRLVGSGKEIAPTELAAMASSALRSALPAGVALVSVDPAPHPVLVPEGASITAALVPQLPRRTGRARVTVTVELSAQGRVAARVPLSATVEVGEQAVRPDVPKGTALRLLLTRGAIVITAPGVVLSDANVGDTVRAVIRPTGKTVRAVVTSAQEGKVVDP